MFAKKIKTKLEMLENCNLIKMWMCKIVTKLASVVGLE